MTELNTLIFCNRQYYFMMIMSKLHIAKLLKHEGCYDPITNKEVCKHVLIRMPKIICPLYSKVLYNLNDIYGRNKLQTLMNIGTISKKIS